MIIIISLTLLQVGMYKTILILSRIRIDFSGVLLWSSILIFYNVHIGNLSVFLQMLFHKQLILNYLQVLGLWIELIIFNLQFVYIVSILSLF